MKNTKFNSELAAHNVATILTQASIGEIHKEQIPIDIARRDSSAYTNYSKEYAYYYKEFYKAALKHFKTDLNDDFE